MIAEVWAAVYGEELASKRRSGPDQVRVLCPWHPERHPSCDISLRKNAFICRSCGAQGGYLDVVVLAGFAHDRREAAKWLERRGIACR